MVRIAILYTLDEERDISHNPGDDIVKDGQKYLFRKLFGADEVQFEIFAAQKPAKWFEGMVGLAKVHPKKIWPVWSFVSTKRCRINQCDYVINAAGPRLFSGKRFHSALEPWALVLSRILMQGPVRLINLGFGTNFSGDWEKRSEIVRALDRLFCRRFAGNALINICRDPIAAEILQKQSIHAEVSPCPSLLARRYHDLKSAPEKQDYIALNFHPAGTRSRQKGVVCDDKWILELERVVRHLEEREMPIKFIMHEKMELDLARKYFPFSVEGRYILPKSIPEYLNAYGRASVALTSRVHGAYGAASMGTPSVVIGSDSRITMIDLLDLPAVSCLEENAAETMIDSFDRLYDERETQSRRLLELCDQVERGYCDRLKKVLTL